jgi:predicted O-linked N-acetylglucosamine transferase (SPINDLY family)
MDACPPLPVDLKRRLAQLAAARQFDSLISRLREHLDRVPRCEEAWRALAESHEEAGDLPSALVAYGRVVELRPTAYAWNRISSLHYHAGDEDGAILAVNKALELAPRDSLAWGNLGMLEQNRGNRSYAERCYRNALEGDNPLPGDWHRLGVLYAQLGRFGDALAAHEKGLELDQTDPSGWNNLSSVLLTLERADSAREAAETAVKLDPGRAEFHFTLAAACDLSGDMETARAEYDRACGLNPRLDNWRLQRLGAIPVLYRDVAEIARTRERFSDELVDLERRGVHCDPYRELFPIQFRLAYQGLDDRPLQERLAKLVRGENHLPAIAAKKGRAKRDRLHVAFVSRYLVDHTVGHLTAGLITGLTREHVEVTVLHLGQPSAGDVSRRLAARADNHLGVPLWPSLATDKLKELAPDVVVFPEVGMDSVCRALAHQRFAPLQIALWGHPVTTGSPMIDVFLSWDAAEPLGAAAHYTERLVRFRDPPMALFRPRPSADRPARSQCERGVTRYLCPQSLFKFHPDFDPLLRGILEADPRGRLVLLEPPQKLWRQQLEARWRATWDLPLLDRIDWEPRRSEAAFVDLLADADVMLDTVHFGGGYTSFLALGLGIPIVTLPGEFLRGRVTTGCYRHLGLSELVAPSTDDYVATAVAWGTDRDLRDSISAEILDRSAHLFEANRGDFEFERWLLRSVASDTALEV